jgi:AbiV family abortive infection protein
MNAAIANAKRLADDAKLLLGAGRYPSASSLAILSLEEQGKSAILRGLVAANSEAAVQEAWQQYRRHTEKNYLALLPDRIRKGVSQLHELSDLFSQSTEAERTTFDAIKQLGFYSDCCGDAHWSVPSEVVDKKLATLLVSLAGALSESNEPVSAEELELWRSHMSSGMTRENLLRWCDAMVAAGLKKLNYAEEMRRFTSTRSGTIDELPIV